MFLQNSAVLVVGFLFMPKHNHKGCQNLLCLLHDVKYIHWGLRLQLVAFRERSLQWCGRRMLDLGKGIP